MSVPTGEWADLVVVLDDLLTENQRLARLATTLLIALARRDELLTFARAEIDLRWPEAA